MNKKGLTQTMLVTIIILVATLVILLFVVGSIFFNFQGNIDKETCRASVVSRASLSAGPIQSANYIPLKCRTEQICISGSNDKCEDVFLEESNKNPITVLKVPDENAKKQVLDEVSQSLYDCHKMLGEGELNFFPNKIVSENHCVICSRLVFDDTVVEEVGSIKYLDLYNNMAQLKDESGRNYFEYVYGGDLDTTVGTLNALADETGNDFDFDEWEMDLSEEQVIVTRITSKNQALSVGGGVVTFVIGTAAAIYVLPAFIGVSAIAVIAGGTGALVGGFTYVKAFPDGNGEYWAPQIIPYKAEYLNSKELKCGSFDNLP